MFLVVMAAGMGSRYGGLKQLDPIGPNGEFILDYTAYDAKKAGFDKAVFVIKKENLEIFEETVGKRIGRNMQVSYAFQELDDLPNGYSVPENRVKQWGTAHAVLAARNIVNEPFAAVNADDFYGRESFELLYKSLTCGNDSAFCGSMAGYILKNTLTENGTVSRGECFEDERGRLVDIHERTKIKRQENGETAYFENEEWHVIPENTIVSMNCWGLKPEFFDYAQKGFKVFLDANAGMAEKCEYYLPDAVKYYIKESTGYLDVKRTSAKWYGVTYREDRQAVCDYIERQIETGVYPRRLWDK